MLAMMICYNSYTLLHVLNVCVVEIPFCVCLGCVEGEGCVDQVGIYDEPGGKSYRGMLPEQTWPWNTYGGYVLT